MPFPAADLHALRSERRLLLGVLAVARRCDGAAPGPLLDAALAGSGRGTAGRARRAGAGRRRAARR